jgi:hypothetical protein
MYLFFHIKNYVMKHPLIFCTFLEQGRILLSPKPLRLISKPTYKYRIDTAGTVRQNQALAIRYNLSAAQRVDKN